MKRLTIGFIPLTDAAPLIAAHECGFAADQGLELDLVREVSWANIRDKLSVGLFDAAHMLAPLALASALGIGHVKVPLIAPVTLALNGNCITVSTAFAREMGEIPDDPLAALPLIRAAIERRASAGLSPPVFAMTFPFSTHNYLLRAYLAAGGIDPDRDVQLVVIPPPLMVNSLEKGLIDGFCVGSPWNSLAVDRGIGRILCPTSALFSGIPEKVLAIGATPDAGTSLALVAAVARAAAWCADPANARTLADMLAAKHYLDVAAPVVLRTIEGRLVLEPGGPQIDIPDFIRYDVPDAVRPNAGRFAWLYAQMVRWGQTRFDPAAMGQIEALIRADLFDRALESMPVTAAAIVAGDPVGARIDRPFNPFDIGGYLAGFDARGLPAGTR
ncbi:ABC transporter substrate-binding protein [Phreatobacter aquaticus]|uniref:ABC transporter substrate-binding protein n=1 Tax=Phreatobacter aquaticus TaxID=2570229 RepID=A0A4D7QIL5_9HYPH|nr:CmpA/NrtA family ABC transporter substrate-binding protein [Phreatobacter aquaticus]QCK85246.1 ABC transporter substrate-binding protein [Phreatobacter aquaticus]